MFTIRAGAPNASPRRRHRTDAPLASSTRPLRRPVLLLEQPSRSPGIDVAGTVDWACTPVDGCKDATVPPATASAPLTVAGLRPSLSPRLPAPAAAPRPTR